MTRDTQNEILIDHAADGLRLVLAGEKPRTLWGGLGNASGLHSYASTLIRSKWEKSGERFSRRLGKLPSGTVVEVRDYRNTTRDRGRWVTIKTITLK